MAHGHLFPTVPFDGTIVYLDFERIRCAFRPVFFSRDVLLIAAFQFANVHDVSWGTKGDNKVSTDLGVISGKGPNKNEVEVAVPTADTDINAAYEDAIHVLSTKPPKADRKVDPATEQEDYYKTFRTNVSHGGPGCQDGG